MHSGRVVVAGRSCSRWVCEGQDLRQQFTWSLECRNSTGQEGKGARLGLHAPCTSRSTPTPVFLLQGPEHPNPGKPFTARGFPRQCYLPDNAQGRKVKPRHHGRGGALLLAVLCPPAGASARWWGGEGLAQPSSGKPGVHTCLSSARHTAPGGGGLDPGLDEVWATPFWGPCCGLGILRVPGVQGEVTGTSQGL